MAKCGEVCWEYEIKVTKHRLMLQRRNMSQPVHGDSEPESEWETIKIPATSSGIKVDDDGGNPKPIGEVIATSIDKSISDATEEKRHDGNPCPDDCPCDSVKYGNLEPMDDVIDDDWTKKEVAGAEYQWKVRVERKRKWYRGTCNGQDPAKEDGWEDSLGMLLKEQEQGTKEV